MNHAQWRSEADFKGVTFDPASERLHAAIRALGPRGGPHAVAFRVVRSIGALDTASS